MNTLAGCALAAWLCGTTAASAEVRLGGRDYRHAQWTAADGVPARISSMAQTTDGWLWIGTRDGLYRFDGLRFVRQALAPRQGHANEHLTHLHAGPAGELYLAFAAEGLALLRPGAALEYLAPPGDPALPVRAMVADTDGSLWIVNDGIKHLAGGRWHSVERHPDWRRSNDSSFALDGRGRLWAVNEFGTWRLDRRSGRFERILEAGGDLALAPDGRVWLVRDDGVVLAADKAGPAPHPPRFDAAQERYSAQFAPDGTLWMSIGCPGRICLIPDAGASRAHRFDPAAAPVRLAGPERVAGQSVRGVLVDLDGNTWISSENGLDLYRRGGAASARPLPAPAVLSLSTDKAEFAPSGTLALPPGTDRFRIEYSAPAPAAPERVHFQYRLDGVDRDWIRAGARRATTYTNIGPGAYLFRVRATGADGTPSATEATLALDIAPTLVQSAWFRLSCVAALALSCALLYCWRVRRLSARLADTLRIKHHERERIARTLHDSFLQTVQGLVLRVDAVAASLPPGTSARGRLEAVLEDAGAAIGEGRDQLQELRADDAPALDEMLRDVLARLGEPGLPALSLRIEGRRCSLRQDVVEEMFSVAREALRNACTHAEAAHVRINLDYGRHALALAVADDGTGIPAPILQAGERSGHWGLRGMRERAARIGATLSIESVAAAGTRVSLTVPAARAYSPPAEAGNPR